MRKFLLLSMIFLFASPPVMVFSQPNTRIEYIPKFENSNYPQIAYWFLTPEILENGKYLDFLDNMAKTNPFDLIFLDARNGPSLGDVEKMHPILEQIVSRAHEKNMKVGYRAHVSGDNQVQEVNSERFIAEAETTLDKSGKGSCSLNANKVRSRNSFKKEIFKIYAFKKTGTGFFDPASCRTITDFSFTVKDQTVLVTMNAGKELSGYTAYVMAEFYFNRISNHSAEAAEGVKRFIRLYADIPFDGVMLDEYGNAQIMPPWQMMFKTGSFRLRSYSLPMAKELEKRSGEPAVQTLFSMRYAPAGKPEIRVKAINTYMNLMREGPMHVEEAMYQTGKKVYGNNCFIAAHNTFHNSLINDEIWATGVKWWSIPREFGFTDEKTPTPTQMGIAMSYPAKAMYNMYYDANIKRFTRKTLTDLRYGIRTFYHAFNDRQWGMGLELPEAVAAINPVENCARLMNRFNPSLPEIKLLVIFGNEALQNWYPEKSDRGRYDINDRLHIEEKAKKLWKAGYLNALVPTDLIASGKLKLNGDHQPVLSGHKYDAVLFLYPQYAKESTLRFLEEYVGNGGKLMMEGTADRDFEGNDITGRMEKIYAGSTETKFSVRKISNLGIKKNAIAGGCKNEDGSFVFTNIRSLRKNRSVTSEIKIDKDLFSVEYTGFSAISVVQEKGLEKLAGAGFMELKKNGDTILKLEHPADIFVEKQNGNYRITIADPTGTNRILMNTLN